MGLGGYLAWTAVARELKKNVPDDVKILPCEGDGKNITKIVQSPVFDNNPFIALPGEKCKLFPMFTNNPYANYCKRDTPTKAYHRYDMHMISQMCEFYGINNPDLKCEMHFTDEEKNKVKEMTSNLGKFITIEPESKKNYTPNREYPFEKWQKVVDDLLAHVKIVQLGSPTSRLLKGVIDFRGRTTFREAALVIGESSAFLSTEGGLVHAATSTNTKSVVIITGYQDYKMVAYPQNVNINLGRHGPCGLKITCKECKEEVNKHDYAEIVEKTMGLL